MDKGTGDLVKWGALAAGAYFLVVKPIMNELGVDPADKNTIDSVSSLDPTANPFNLNFTYSTKSTDQSNPGDYWQQLKSLGDSQGWSAFDPNNDLNNIYVWGEIVHNGLNWWHNVDVNGIDNVFSQVTSQGQVGDIANYLYYNYNKDLWSLLTRGEGIIPIIPNGMPSSDLANIVKKIEALPNN